MPTPSGALMPLPITIAFAPEPSPFARHTALPAMSSQYSVGVPVGFAGIAGAPASGLVIIVAIAGVFELPEPPALGALVFDGGGGVAAEAPPLPAAALVPAALAVVLGECVLLS